MKSDVHDRIHKNPPQALALVIYQATLCFLWESYEIHKSYVWAGYIVFNIKSGGVHLYRYTLNSVLMAELCTSGHKI